MQTARDIAVTAAEGLLPANSNTEVLLVADAAAAGATGDPAEPEEETEQTEPVIKEPGEAVSPSAYCVEEAAGEVAAAATVAGTCPVAGTARTGDSGPSRAG
jgi:hypothetical protein